jgi:type IV secretion system protein VirB4
LFAGRIREWLKSLRKRNVSVVFATQSLSDIQRSTIAPALIESCPTRIFLPSPQAMEPQLKTVYEGFGLNERQIELIARATPKRDYYYHSRLGARVFELALGPVALAFAAASTPQDQRAMDHLLATPQGESFAPRWLRHQGISWAADLATEFSTHGQLP